MKQIYRVVVFVGAVVLVSILVDKLGAKASAQAVPAAAEKIGRYAIVQSTPGGSDTMSLVNTVWVLDTATGGVTAYTVGASPAGPYVMVKLAPGATIR